MEETYFITEFLDEFMEKKGSKHFCLMIDDFQMDSNSEQSFIKNII